MPTLNNLLKICSRYPINGSFNTENKTKLSDIFHPHPIPKDLNNYGVYIIVKCAKENRDNFCKNDQECEDGREIVYIGKSGTLKKNEVLKPSVIFGEHSLSKRIMQGEKKQDWLAKNYYKVYWFVTITKTVCKKNSSPKKIQRSQAVHIPAVVECALLKEFFAMKGCLPIYNQAF
ncbi:MAG: hypothetical protein ACRC9X_02830 [Bacteroidales bacterium]